MRIEKLTRINRREFIKTTMAGLAVMPAFKFNFIEEAKAMRKTKIVLFKTQDRKRGVQEVIRLLDIPSVKNKKVLLKPNFNTADPTPGSTHNDTLSQLIQELKERGAGEITVGERSGPPPTKSVLEEKGVFRLAQELGFKIINFEELRDEDWVHLNPPGNHWQEGFYLAKPAVLTEYFISSCCLKTHQYGGVFTLSLKLAVGLTPKKLMGELHSSPDMRKMIAELNLGYNPRFIVMDGIEAFVDGGPSTGRKVNANVFVGSTDRVALDAVGVAILKELGSNKAIMETKIFEQEQIKRAIELGLGIAGPQQIEFITPDEPSRLYSEKIKTILAEG